METPKQKNNQPNVWVADVIDVQERLQTRKAEDRYVAVGYVARETSAIWKGRGSGMYK